ncbi:hypothetical protein POM88_011252 [Heracleum sosnowskyi]|uniref:Transmembrane protein n=1 Tax=Heracleum sosnowskyi TaxID=360622 RepID=A0AAD8IV53_9APIA|nr:hypothetical protein POM88_011252 [Heracleum sosnowskyi]
MVSRIKTSLLVFLVLFICLSSGTVSGFSNGAGSIYSLHQDGSSMVNSRKLLSHEVPLRQFFNQGWLLCITVAMHSVEAPKACYITLFCLLLKVFAIENWKLFSLLV